MKFEPSQTAETLGPLFQENSLSDIPIFGPEKVDVGAIVSMAAEACNFEDDMLVDEVANDAALPKAFNEATTVAQKLKALRAYIWGALHPGVVDTDNFRDTPAAMVDILIRLQDDGPEDPFRHSSRSLHEALLRSTMETAGFPTAAQIVLDHVMLLRAKEKYLFDCSVNRAVVDDDAWLKGAWGWIEGEALCLFFQETQHKLTICRCRGCLR